MKRRKYFIIIIVVILIIALFILLTVCLKSKHSYNYPKGWTAQDCYHQYEFFDPNIKYTECYEFIKNKGILKKLNNFSAIKDCEDLSFMVLFKRRRINSIHVVRNSDCNINPSVDYTPASAELFWYISGAEVPEYGEDDEYYYEPQYMSKTIIVIDKKEAIDEVMKIAAKDTCFQIDALRQEKSETVPRYELKGIYSEKCELYVKVSFEECAGLVFIGEIMVDDWNHSYLRHDVYVIHEDEKEDLKLKVSHQSTSDLYYRMGENMDAFVQQVIDGMGAET